MEETKEILDPKCKYIDCDDNCCYIPYMRNTFDKYCSFHSDGGIFGTGESYEQYQTFTNSKRYYY